MECFIISASDVDRTSNSFILRGDEARHAVRVLRISEGEQIMATTLTGFCYKAICTKSGQPSKNEWILEAQITEIFPEHNEPPFDIELIQGITLGASKMEEIAEKATEIGIRSFIPVYTKRTEKKTINRDRLLRIIEGACKQSHRARMPELSDPMNFSEAMQRAKDNQRDIIVLHESAPQDDSLLKILNNLRSEKISLAIGPEGGFDESEVAMALNEFDSIVASLGERRLRAETAAIMAVSVAIGTLSR